MALREVGEDISAGRARAAINADLRDPDNLCQQALDTVLIKMAEPRWPSG